jgi:hypothetical protein
LGDDLQDQAKALADKAKGGALALFLGAGVSASAGLPLWGELLDKLARRAHMGADERDALRRLNALDQAALLEKRLGGPDALQAALRDEFTAEHFSLAHALLAALPVRPVVTTNYDQLFERAWEDAGQSFSVLPYRLRRGADRWVLKMHGCVSRPEDIVLTRQDQIGYGERNAALAGVVQALLLTQHMLFVGFSLNDDNFHRIAEAVRRAVRSPRNNGNDAEPFGTAVVLERNPLVEELWKPDLNWVAMREKDQEVPADHKEQHAAAAARRLDLFLDCFLAHTADDCHLLDPRYRELLTNEDRQLRAGLLRFLHALPINARGGAAWRQVSAVLARLGLPSSS